MINIFFNSIVSFKTGLKTYMYLFSSAFIHSFIHYWNLYSASSSLLLRSAPDPCTAKKKSFEARVECVRKNPGEQSLCQRKPIPQRGASHRECTDLGCGGTIRLSIPVDAMTMTTTTTTMMMRIFVYLFTADRKS